MVELGQKVRDRVTGYGGIVITLGYHFDGCRRFGVRGIPSALEENPKKVRTDSRPDEEFFFEEQLEVVQANTEWTDLETQTETEVSLGDRCKDMSSGFRGTVVVINTKLFNEPRVLLKTSRDGEALSEWTDVSSLKIAEKGYRSPKKTQDDQVDNPQQTGSTTDSGTRQLSE